MKPQVTVLSVAAILVAIIGGWIVATVQAQDSAPPSLAPQGLTVANSPNPGTANLAWTAIPGVSSYRIGRLSDDDYQAYAETWRERFAYSDVTATSAFTLTGLIPGEKYYFIVGQNHGGGVAWSQWAELTLNSDAQSCPIAAVATPQPTPTPTQGPTPTPRPTPTGTGDYDADNDGLIEISNLAQLDAIRWDLDGDGVSHVARYIAAFPNAMRGMGCPAGCAGYELVADLNFDTNGNGEADEGDAYWNDGMGWVSIGESDRRFKTTLNGGEHAIANLYINGSAGYVGLFGYTGDNSLLNRVRLTSASVTGDSCGGCGHGGLVAQNNGTISASYVSGDVSGTHPVGGLAARNNGTIIDSSTSADVSGRFNGVGGLVGNNDGDITSSYATGSVSGDDNAVGGLVGWNTGAITASFATGRVSGSDEVGGLVGRTWHNAITASYATGDVSGTGDDIGGLAGRSYGPIADSFAIGQVRGSDATSYIGGLVGYSEGTTSTSYWDTQTTGQLYSAGGIGKTTSELQTPAVNTGIYAEWNPDFWDFGTSSQYPVLKYGGLDVAAQRP